MIGQYERLSEQPIAKQSTLPFICFTDDPTLTSDTWRTVLIEPMFASDPIRSQRAVKIEAHKHLPDYDVSLYIDASFTLTVPPERLLDEVLGDGDIAVPTLHWERSLDEFLWAAEYGRDDPTRIYEQLNHYAAADAEVLEERPYMAGMLFRHHQRDAVKALQECWFAHVLRYSRRDQLSFNFACKQTKVEPKRLMIDISGSWFHTWSEPRRYTNHMSYKPSMSYRPIILKNHQLERRERARDALLRELEATVNSRSVLLATIRTWIRRFRHRPRR
jgi:hypothetical protein